MAVLEEVGIPFDLYQVDNDAGECNAIEYREIQLLGLIPALKLPDGSSLFESAAIVQFISDCHGLGKLAPSWEEPDRARYLQWLHFMSGTIYPSYNRYYWPPEYSDDPEGIERIREYNCEIVLQQWQVIEDSLKKDGPWLLGKRFSSCDIYLQMMTTWHKSPSTLLNTFPCIRNLAKGVLAREACQRAIQRHKFDTGFEAVQEN